MRRTLFILIGLTIGVSLFAATDRRAEAAPVFMLPWAGIDGWRYTQGFHIDYALDFQPEIAPNCGETIDTTHTIRPVAPGTVVEVRMRGAPEPALPVGLTIDHGGGWSSYYTHLANVPSAVATVGAHVDYDTDLGNPSCYSSCSPGVGPPCATGRHLHFTLRKDGSGAGIMQATLCGWTVGSDSGMSRNGYTFYPTLDGSNPIVNAFCPPATPLAASTPTATSTSTPVDTPAGTPGATSTPASTATQTLTPVPTALWPAGDAGCDGVADASDALLVLQVVAGNPASWCTPFADSNADGVLDANDAALILQYTAGLVSQLPVTAP